MSTTNSYHPSPTELLTKGVVKPAKGWVSSIRVTNSNAAVRFFQLFDSAVQPVASVVAVGTLTSDATIPTAADTVQIGSTIYTYKSTLTEVQATTTLTSSAVTPTDGDTVTLGSGDNARTYTFKTTLSIPNVANEVLIGGSAAAALDNIKSAVNQTDVTGTAYSANTKAHPTITATTNTNTTQIFVARIPGTTLGQNTWVTSTTNTGPTLSFTGTTLAGGVAPVPNEVLLITSAAVALDNLGFAINANGGTGDYGGAGIEFSTGTLAHPDVVATTNTNTTQVVQARNPGVLGNTIATLETSSHLSWGATTLASGAGSNMVVRSWPITPITGALPGVLQIDRNMFDDSIRFDNGIAWALSTTDRLFTDSATSTEHSIEVNWR